MKRFLVSLLACVMILSGCNSQPVVDKSAPIESPPIVSVEPDRSVDVLEEPVIEEPKTDVSEDKSEAVEETKDNQGKEKDKIEVSPQKPSINKLETKKDDKVEEPKQETPKPAESVQSQKPSKEPVQEQPKKDVIFDTPVTEDPGKEPTYDPDEPYYDEPEVSEVYFSFTGPDGHIWSSSIDYVEGMNVWQYTKQLLDSYGADYKTTGFGKAVYVASMFGYAQKDYGPMSGWMYYVNGIEAERGCGQITLEEDDSVEWIYVEDYD